MMIGSLNQTGRGNDLNDGHAYPLLIRELLASGLRTASDQNIIYADRHNASYAEFAHRVRRLANLLCHAGIGSHSVVAVMDWDSHRYLECFFAVPMLGAVLHTINFRLSAEQVLYTINHAEDDLILTHRDFLPLIESIRSRLTRPPRIVLLEDDPMEGLPDYALGEYEAMLSEASADFAPPDLDENTRATLFYTTGTTGDPKGVYYSHRQLVLHSLTVAAGLGSIPGPGGLHRDDVYMPITPLFHVHGWGFPYIATLLGLQQIYPGRYDPTKLLHLIAHHRVTFSHCVPTILAMLLAAPQAATTDLSRWRVLIGGAALPIGLAEQARAKGIDVHAAYGMSETCPFLTVADMMAPHRGRDNLPTRVATGRALPMVDVRVVDPSMHDLPPGGPVTGEVVARAPWLTEGYLKNPSASAALWEGGYLHTSDVGYIDPDGTLHITDRLKDVIKSGGEWISSLAIESVVSQVPAVTEVAAVGVPDNRWGERPVLVLCVGAAEPSAVEAAARSAICEAIQSGRLSKWASPDHIVFMPVLPKTSVGKIDKKAIRVRLAAAQ